MHRIISRRQFFLSSIATGAGVVVAPNLATALEPRQLLELTGTSAPSLSYYTRMFPELPPQGANNPHLEEGLVTLGKEMKGDPREVPSHDKLPHLPHAGYTYLGQFIDHDLT